MPDLETLLRDVRPEPDPEWAKRLDARAAARFPTPPPRWKRPFITLAEHLVAFSAAGAMASVLIVVIVAGVSLSGGDSDSGGSNRGSSGASTAKAPATPEVETTAGEDSATSGSSGSSTAAPTRKVKPSTFVPQSGSGSGSAAAPLTNDDRAVLENASITLSTRPEQVETVDRPRDPARRRARRLRRQLGDQPVRLVGDARRSS